MLTPQGDRMQGYGTRGTINACEAAGLPVIEIEASMVDERSWNREQMEQRVGAFLEGRVAPIADARRAREAEEARRAKEPGAV
jgi:hypothetical protein